VRSKVGEVNYAGSRVFGAGEQSTIIQDQLSGTKWPQPGDLTVVLEGDAFERIGGGDVDLNISEFANEIALDSDE